MRSDASKSLACIGDLLIPLGFHHQGSAGGYHEWRRPSDAIVWVVHGCLSGGNGGRRLSMSLAVCLGSSAGAKPIGELPEQLVISKEQWLEHTGNLLFLGQGRCGDPTILRRKLHYVGRFIENSFVSVASAAWSVEALRRAVWEGWFAPVQTMNLISRSGSPLWHEPFSIETPRVLKQIRGAKSVFYQTICQRLGRTLLQAGMLQVLDFNLGANRQAWVLEDDSLAWVIGLDGGNESSVFEKEVFLETHLWRYDRSKSIWQTIGVLDQAKVCGVTRDALRDMLAYRDTGLNEDSPDPVQAKAEWLSHAFEARVIPCLKTQLKQGRSQIAPSVRLFRSDRDPGIAGRDV